MKTFEIEQLQAELDALRAENAVLKTATVMPEAETTGVKKSRKGWWRAVLSAVLIIVAGILVPVSVAGGWARAQLVSEEAFVATFAPLADDPGVQELVIDEATAAINESLDLETYTDNLFDGLATLDLPPRAISALELLREPAASGVQSLIDTSVTRVVESDAFSAVWRTALVASHRALVATATAGESDGVVSLADDGTLGIELGPIIEELKARMIDQGIGVASLIPAINQTIVIVQSDALLLVGTVYALAVTVGYWLPFVCLGLFALGIVVARRRSVAVLGTGVAIFLGAGALATGIGLTGTVLGLNAPALGIAPEALNSIFFAVVGAMRDTAVVLMFFGVVVAISGWLGGRSAGAAKTRAASESLTTSLRGSLRRRGLNTGGVGDWLYAQRVLVRVIILVLAIVLLFSLRPLSFGDIVWVIVLALLVWLAATLLQRAPGDLDGDAETVAVVDETAGDVVDTHDGDTLVLDDASQQDGDTVPLDAEAAPPRS